MWEYFSPGNTIYPFSSFFTLFHGGTATPSRHDASICVFDSTHSRVFSQKCVWRSVCDCMLLSLFIVVFLRLSTLHTYTYSMDRKFAYVHYMYLYVLRNCSAFEVNGLFDSQFLGKSVPWQQGLRRMSFRLWSVGWSNDKHWQTMIDDK